MKKSMSIENFCKEHDLSKPTFYRLKKEGKAPSIMRVGRRVLISETAAAEWRKKMEVSH